MPVIRGRGGRVPDGDENYFGFGLPANLQHCLECTSHSSTLVFEDTLRRGYYLEWDNFPYPALAPSQRTVLWRNLDDSCFLA